MKSFEEIFNEDYDQIDLNTIKIGDSLLSRNGLYAELTKINPKTGKYGVRFNMDYSDEPLTYFEPSDFEQGFRVEKKKNPDDTLNENITNRWNKLAGLL